MKPLAKILTIFFFIGVVVQIEAQSTTESDLEFSEELLANFSDSKFLKEEKKFISKFGKDIRRTPEIYYDLAVNIYKKENILGAITVFNRSVEVYPFNENLITTLAYLYEETKNKKKAIESYKKAKAISIKSKQGNEERYQAEINRLQRPEPKLGLDILFENNKYTFIKKDMRLITRIIKKSEKRIRTLLPTLPKDIRVIVTLMDRDIEGVGGVTGRADSHTPGEVFLEISNIFPGGITTAVKTALPSTLFHEFHHLSRGWTILDNKFKAGIPIAAVNEGLAVVFANVYTGYMNESTSYPKEIDTWIKEILALPVDADYQKWMMGTHPDGRTSIGYRAGNYIIEQAINNSGKTVIELSNLTPKDILELAGYHY